MTLIKVGSINDFAVKAKENVLKEKSFLKGINTFLSLNEVSRDIPPNSFELITSSDQRGIGLHSIELKEGFEGFLQNYLNSTNEIYFVAWSYDFSGQPVNFYPGVNANSEDVMFPMKVGTLKEFFGEGINLFPKRQVKGGIAIRIQIWESDAKVRNFGKAMIETADAIKKSGLNNLLSLISLGIGVPGATITMVEEAAIELAKVIGIILKTNGDDYVDFFEGYYASDKIWEIGEDAKSGNSSILTLNKY